MEAKRYHQWVNRNDKLFCLVCSKEGNGILNLDQICPGPLMANLFETVVSEATLQQSEELHLAPQEA